VPLGCKYVKVGVYLISSITWSMDPQPFDVRGVCDFEDAVPVMSCQTACCIGITDASGDWVPSNSPLYWGLGDARLLLQDMWE
jgi:hypothetical protein